MSKLTKLIFAIHILGLFLFAKDVINKDQFCTINWTQYKIQCVGTSAQGQNPYGAYLSAKVVAQRNLLEKIKGINIDSSTTINSSMKKNNIIRASVRGTIKGSKVISREYHKAKRYADVTVELDLVDDLLINMLKEINISRNTTIYDQFLRPFYLNASVYQYSDIVVLEKLVGDFKKTNNEIAIDFIANIITKLKNNNYTGIIIDANDVSSFDMALIPKIRTSLGKELYPADYVTDDTLLSEHGVVSYEIGLEDARLNKRIYSNPIILKAKNIYGKKSSDLVLNYESIEVLKSVDRSLLNNAKILILVGK
ncbi:MAG: hypothetical protein U9N59_06815 [Campylobacterota bacterium]|nr:hypothetical protein [Campylobacterota bacterium]